MSNRIIVQREYLHSIDLVWRAITDSQAIEKWLMPNDFQPLVGHKFMMHTEPQWGFDGKVHCEVLELTEPTRMVWRWQGGGQDTTVSFELAELGPARTRLLLTHEGFKGVGGWFARQFLRSGWKSITRQRIAEVLDRSSELDQHVKC